ncbi:MAG: LPS export ABC transporter permease LptF [Candidatus Adiutrix sp.]|jgi:lipopolysaccharide export system permease protein|nr:LPS export ABC transporter permease LptF [Candidatus Adiutrix sp.]
MRLSIIHRYILSEIIPGFLVNILVFTSVMLMARAMQLANLVIARGVSPWQVLEIFLLTAPRILTMSLPMGTLLAVLTAFMRFSADSELTVLKASGLSIYQMSPSVLCFGAAAAGLTALFSLWLAPISNWRFKNELLDLAKTRADLTIVEQTFIRSFPGLVIYVGQMALTGGVMEQVFIHDARRAGESAVIAARRGRLGLDRETGVLVFELAEGIIDRVRAGQKVTDSIFFDTYELKVSPGEEMAGQEENGLLRGRAETPTRDLAAAAARQSNPRAGRAFRLEWHERWARPAAAFLMTLVGLPLGASFRARGRNFPFLTALVIYLIYYVLSSLGWSLGMMGRLSPATSVWGPNILLSSLGLFLLTRVNRHVPVDPAEFMRRLRARRRARPRNP